ncbi:DUF5329 domain-containing protein [Hydrogenophaga sp. SL48]|uniref:DUF5329 family protein n=1 Tax=Hydrogenophaga sp. SL48 TaxID=2806347 RepID=UPI001F289354|nr:DUF5329 domain-containing protein [Hydrogenophaga sp. SL48]UJW81304.1 DUF5329 domain-containing protein [Hydrogenophaga sp. SL48]
MPNPHRLLLTLSLLSLSAAALAEPLPPAAKAEVTAVLNRLEASGCEFNRNDRWYSAAQARAHLQRKLDYVESKASAKTAEGFINLAASKSSVTGVAYQVRCSGQAPEASAAWLLKQLAELRRAKPGA